MYAKNPSPYYRGREFAVIIFLHQLFPRRQPELLLGEQ
jgi:hypothetical protein